MSSIPKYSRIETERRWLVSPGQSWLPAAAPCRKIEDRYLECGRLRLRRITSTGSGEVVLKLTKKYPTPTLGDGPIVTVYLTPGEFDALVALPARELRKTRHYVDHADHVFGVDVFEGPLEGLVTCELELEDRRRLASVPGPRWTLREITDEPFFTGANLATVTADELGRRLGVYTRVTHGLP
jgi:CYTH domain-containing protein